MSPAVELVTIAAALAHCGAAAFTITMDKASPWTKEIIGDEQNEDNSGLRPNFGHWWILIKDQTLHLRNSTPIPSHETDDGEEVDAMSVVWYLGAFGGLIAFFLVVTCSEWCCSRQGYTRPQPPPPPPPDTKPQTPPPPYHLFAPPPYTETLSPTKPPSVYVVPLPPS